MHKKIIRGGRTAAASLFLLAAPALAHAGGMERIQFVVVDSLTRLPILDAQVVVEDLDGGHLSRTVAAGPSSQTFNTHRWALEPGVSVDKPMIVTIPMGTSVALTGQAQPANAQQPPVARSISVSRPPAWRPRRAVRPQARRPSTRMPSRVKPKSVGASKM